MKQFGSRIEVLRESANLQWGIPSSKFFPLWAERLDKKKYNIENDNVIGKMKSCIKNDNS